MRVPRSATPIARRGAAAAAAVGIALLLAACGGDDASGASAAANDQQGRRPGGFATLTSKQRACLKQEGVTLPDRGARPDGQRPNVDPAQMQKLRAALQKCGIDFLNRPGPEQQQEQQQQPSSSSS